MAADAAGVRSLKLKQYSNDHTETAAAVTEAAVRAALPVLEHLLDDDR